MFLGWLSTKIFQIIPIHQKTWLPGGMAHFPYITIIANFKKLLVKNHWPDLFIISHKMFFGWLSTKIHIILIHQKTWPPGAGPFFQMWVYSKLQKSSCQKLIAWSVNNFTQMFLGWTSAKIVQIMTLWSIIYTLYRKSNKSCHEPLGLFEHNFAQMLIGWPIAKIVQTMTLR